MDTDSNGSGRWLPPKRFQPEQFLSDVRKNRIVEVYAAVLLIVAVGQLTLLALAGLEVMKFPEPTMAILAGSVPIELLVTVRMVVMKVIENDRKTED